MTTCTKYFTATGLLLALLTFAHSVTAQCIFTSRQNGNWTTSTTWTRTAGTSGCTGNPSIPRSGDVIIIASGHQVILNTDFQVTGGLTIQSGGALREGELPQTLTIGSSTGSNAGQLLNNSGTLQITSLVVQKSTARLDGYTHIKCLLDISNVGSLLIGGSVVLDGNWTVGTGNAQASGSGSVTVKGCASASNGAWNDIKVDFCFMQQSVPGCGSFSCSNNIPSSNIIGGTTCNRVLPVSLVSFKLVPQQQCTVQLEWITASETNNNYFFVEKSEDGVNFRAITRINGQQTTLNQTKYRFCDNELNRSTTYYRLKQVDADNTYTYSNVVAAQPRQEETGIVFFPNPSDGKKISFRMGAVGGAFTIFIYDNTGNMVTWYALENEPEGTIEFEQGLKAGLYFVQVVGEGKVYSSKMVVN